MALTDENGTNMVMPVSPMTGTGGGFGFGDNGWWFILLFILLGGWGNGFGGIGNGNLASDAATLYPWMNQSNQINGGFRDQMLNTQISGIQQGITAGFGDIQNSLCSGFGGVNMNLVNGFANANLGIANGFSGVNATITGAQNAIAQQMYGNQIADMERSYAAQTASMQSANAMQSQLAQCCCENRAATADLKYTVATENCADRTAAMENTRDIIDAQTRGTQAILDKLCALELDGVKAQLAQAQRDNIGLQNQLNMANLAASQSEQTAQIRAAQATTANQLVNELRSCPIPSQPVYGNQPIFTCGGTMGCGCGAA